jgi:hypothetical protein
MDEARELELRRLFAAKARALEELFFCTLHPEKTGAIRRYADLCVQIERLRS